MMHLSFSLLLFLTFSQGYAQQKKIVRVKIPAQYSALNNEEVIKRLLILPTLDKTNYVFHEDTTVIALEFCGGNGVYRYGRGKGSHIPSNYHIVTKVGDELKFVRNHKSQWNHKRLIRRYYAGKPNSDNCFANNGSMTPLFVRVAKLIEINNRKSFNDIF